MTQPGPAPVGRFSQVVVDCADPQRLAEFWSAVLGVGIVKRRHQYLLDPTIAGGPALCFQLVPEAKATKNRLHLDVAVTDLEEAGARMEALGGSRLGAVEEGAISLLLFADPEGNELCLVLQEA